MQKKTIRQYYILSAMFNAGGMSLIGAIYVTFLIHNGLNLLEVNLVNTTFYLTLFICEIPTGAFADIFGRKTSFVAACGLLCLSMFIYGCSHSFLGFILAEMMGAVGKTFSSGAFQAWLVDSLKHHGSKDDTHTKIFARENLLNQILGGLGAVAGSYLAARNPALPWFAGGCILAATTVAAYFVMEETYFVKKSFSWKMGIISMRDITVSSIRYGAKHKAVRFVLAITGIQIFATQSLNMYWQVFFKDRGISEAHLGFLFVGIMGTQAAAALLVSFIKTKDIERSVLIKTQVAAGILIIGTSLVSGLPIAVALFLLHEMGRGSWRPMISGYLNARIPSGERATIISFCSIAPHVGGAVGLLVSGIIAQTFGISAAWMISGAAFIVGALLIGTKEKKRRNDAQGPQLRQSAASLNNGL